MLHRINGWWWLLGAVLGLRLLGMVWLPFADTTEPRYAEISRLMVTTGDWITPWFAPGIPFWGKPPLAFWSEAASFKLLGVNEFAARLPSWLATLGTLALIHVHARSFFGARVARWSLLVYSTCALVYVAAGAVLMDPFLALATTWAMVAFAMATRQPTWPWQYGFFVALAVGLLAKGPLMLVLVAGPLIPWLAWHPSARESCKTLPWFSGLALMLALSAPWYVLAELKTPGFLNYFLVGEHFLRFVDSGWAGDLYGNAHERMKGAIWLDVLLASFPWGVVALGVLLRRVVDPAGRRALGQALQDPGKTYLLAWALFTPVFFTFAGNILWTYVLPGLAAFSILTAIALAGWQEKRKLNRRMLYALASLCPLLISAYMALVVAQPQRLKTEKELVAHAVRHMQPGERLAFLGATPFSATFYSRGQASSITSEDLAATVSRPTGLYLAVPRVEFDQVSKSLNMPLTKVFESQRYILTIVSHQSPGY